jgi:hypothetical protein
MNIMGTGRQRATRVVLLAVVFVTNFFVGYFVAEALVR